MVVAGADATADFRVHGHVHGTLLEPEPITAAQLYRKRIPYGLAVRRRGGGAEGRGEDLLAFAVRLFEVSEVGGQEVLGDRERGVRIEPPAPLVQTLAQQRRVDLEVAQSPPAPDVLDQPFAVLPPNPLQEAEVDHDVEQGHRHPRRVLRPVRIRPRRRSGSDEHRYGRLVQQERAHRRRKFDTSCTIPGAG